MTTLPTVRAAQLAQLQSSQPPWLIEGLWGKEAVGIIGGEPKCCKSFLALDLAVAVAAGTSCLRHFPLRQRGPVLLYAAEDAAAIVRQRLEGIAHAAGVDFASLDIHVITVPTLRLDRSEHQQALAATVALVQPKLLALVRLHGIDENVAAEIAPLLAYLRTLQRNHHTAVALVHHARKGAAHERGGQALRGSSDLHAWGDSNLYLRRHGQNLQLSSEHRAAPGLDRLPLALKINPPALALEVFTPPPPPVTEAGRPSPLDRIEQLLRQATTALSQRQLREQAHMRTCHVVDALAKLTESGRVIRSADGYRLNP